MFLKREGSHLSPETAIPEVDKTTGISVSRYGAHIFHTGNNRVWEYIQRFGHFVALCSFIMLKAIAKGCVYSLSQSTFPHHQAGFFRNALHSQKKRADMWTISAIKSIIEPKNFEEQGASLPGDAIYTRHFSPRLHAEAMGA